ncbi:MAG: HAMP domain-containing histidine kinase [Defluviitaleaceae bacterium]|nr:HAMP domain-containing histidine kinase [Defluviitaleaceae bacterium]
MKTIVRAAVRINGLIQAHIVMAFSILIVTSFVIVSLLFILSVNAYTEAAAIYALNVARAEFEGKDAPRLGRLARVFAQEHRFVTVRSFEVDENYVPVTYDYINLPANFSARNFAAPRRISVDDYMVFITAVPIEPDVDTGAYAGAVIFYLNVGNLNAFTAVMIRILLFFVAVIWMLATFIAVVIADSLLKPLRQLRDFVRQIGRGDFTPNTQTFWSDEFNELNQSLNISALRLDAYDSEQKAFFQNVSHEFRTPLTTIKMYGEGIQSGVMDGPTAAATILEAQARLADMVDDILYIARLDNVSPPPMEEINIRITVKECIRQQLPVADVRGIEIRYASSDEPLLLYCAMNHIERALNNLISNAIRFAKTTVSVECYTLGAVVYVRVCDDGPGFEPDAIPHVFERFYRGKGGLTGIGLSTVKSIVDLHGGIATAENGEKNGAVLTISIPRAKRAALTGDTFRK